MFLEQPNARMTPFSSKIKYWNARVKEKGERIGAKKNVKKRQGMRAAPKAKYHNA